MIIQERLHRRSCSHFPELAALEEWAKLEVKHGVRLQFVCVRVVPHDGMFSEWLAMKEEEK